jgi:hypothetical protein
MRPDGRIFISPRNELCHAAALLGKLRANGFYSGLSQILSETLAKLTGLFLYIVKSFADLATGSFDQVAKILSDQVASLFASGRSKDHAQADTDA